MGQNTTRLQWSDDYRTGIPTLDDQHLTILLLYNDVLRALEGRASQHMVAETIDSLIFFMRKHFAWEKRFMDSTGYHRAAEHAARHDRFESVAQAFYQYLGLAGGGETFAGFARDWILEHIHADRDIPAVLAAGSATE